MSSFLLATVGMAVHMPVKWHKFLPDALSGISAVFR